MYVQQLGYGESMNYLAMPNHFNNAGTPRQDPSIKQVGLKNVSNFCYMNTILQTMFHIPPLVNTILSIDFSDEKVFAKIQDEVGLDFLLVQEL